MKMYSQGGRRYLVKEEIQSIAKEVEDTFIIQIMYRG
jgi:hypothetical protein